MTQVEFMRWIEFYRLHPFDDVHRIYRPAALVASRSPGSDMQNMMDWLAPDPKLSGMNSADLNTLKAFGLRK